jgi:hypothetical protein
VYVLAPSNREQLTALTPSKGSLKEVRVRLPVDVLMRAVLDLLALRHIRGGHVMGGSAAAREIAEGTTRVR